MSTNHILYKVYPSTAITTYLKDETTLTEMFQHLAMMQKLAS